MEIPTITRDIEEILRAKTREPVETCGYLIFMKGEYTPSGFDEAIIAIETSLGTVGSVDTSPGMERILSLILEQEPALGVMEFHVHPEILGKQWTDKLSETDIGTIYREFAKSTDYKHLFVTPDCYAFLEFDPQEPSGISGWQFKWGTAPKRTSFDREYSRQELAEGIARAVDRAIGLHYAA